MPQPRKPIGYKVKQTTFQKKQEHLDILLALRRAQAQKVKALTKSISENIAELIKIDKTLHEDAKRELALDDYYHHYPMASFNSPHEEAENDEDNTLIVLEQLPPLFIKLQKAADLAGKNIDEEAEKGEFLDDAPGAAVFISAGEEEEVGHEEDEEEAQEHEEEENDSNNKDEAEAKEQADADGDKHQDEQDA